MKEAKPLPKNCFHPTVLNKLILDFESERVLVEGMSDVGVTTIDLTELGRYNADEYDFLTRLFEPHHVRLISEFSELRRYFK